MAEAPDGEVAHLSNAAGWRQRVWEPACWRSLKPLSAVSVGWVELAIAIIADIRMGIAALNPSYGSLIASKLAPSGVEVHPVPSAVFAMVFAALLDALPQLVVEVEADRIAQRLDSRHQATYGDAAGQRIGDAEGDDEVHQGKGEGLQHGGSPVRESFSVEKTLMFLCVQG
ncbi:hypothetical protein D9M71_623090 [compost metagenome]